MLIMLRLRLRLSRSPNLALADLAPTVRDLGSGTWGHRPLGSSCWLLPDRSPGPAGQGQQGQNAHALFGPAMSRSPQVASAPLSVPRMPEPEVSEVASIATPASKPASQPEEPGTSKQVLLHPARTAHSPHKPTHKPTQAQSVRVAVVWSLVDGSA